MRFVGSITSKNNLEKFGQAKEVSEAALWSVIQEGTLKIHELAVRGIMKRSPGEKAVRYNPKRNVVVSKPGDPPNVDRGIFVKSIQYELDYAWSSGYVGTNDERGPHFEFGTRNMAARPWLYPAWKAAQKTIKALMKRMKLEWK